MTWTDERVQAVEKLWREGISSGDIAKELGLNRNQVLGKIGRLGLLGIERPAKPAHAHSHKGGRRRQAVWPVPQLAPDPVRPRHKEPPSRNVPLLELGTDECRYATGWNEDDGGKHLFCGQPTRNGSWCRMHAQIVFAGGGA